METTIATEEFNAPGDFAVSETNHRGRSWKPSPTWAVCVLAAAFVSTGCATTPEPEVTAEDLASVEERLNDVERTNGRLMVRVEEAERQISRVRDRTESNRIALQRQGQMGQERQGTSIPTGEQARAQQRPDPAPESNYRREESSQAYQADPSLSQRMEQRGGARIPLSDQQSGRSDQESDRSDSFSESGHQEPRTESASTDGQDEIVITNEDMEARFGSTEASSSSPPSSSSSSSDSSSSGSSAHPPVTSERLPTTDELEYPGQESESPSEEVSAPSESSGGSTSDSSADDFAGASHEELMELYQDSLAQYRAGDYASALQGFTSFLDAEPRQDYVDNAMYWIGECHYGLGDYDTSVEHFQRIIDEIPSGNKVPDAMLKMSLAYERMDRPERTVKLLEELVEDHPNSNSARLGEERLEEFSE